jgi:hypothetical protein
MGQVVCIIHKSPHNEEIGCEDCMVQAFQQNLDNFGTPETTYFKVKIFKCPNCHTATDEREWDDASEDCEFCGPMDGIECPICHFIYTECTGDYPEIIK